MVDLDAGGGYTGMYRRVDMHLFERSRPKSRHISIVVFVLFAVEDNDLKPNEAIQVEPFLERSA